MASRISRINLAALFPWPDSLAKFNLQSPFPGGHCNPESCTITAYSVLPAFRLTFNLPCKTQLLLMLHNKKTNKSHFGRKRRDQHNPNSDNTNTVPQKPEVASFSGSEQTSRFRRDPQLLLLAWSWFLPVLIAACDGKNSSYCSLYYDYEYTGDSNDGGSCCSGQTDYLCVYQDLTTQLPAPTPVNQLKVRWRALSQLEIQLWSHSDISELPIDRNS